MVHDGWCSVVSVVFDIERQQSVGSALRNGVV